MGISTNPILFSENKRNKEITQGQQEQQQQVPITDTPTPKEKDNDEAFWREINGIDEIQAKQPGSNAFSPKEGSTRETTLFMKDSFAKYHNYINNVPVINP